MKEEQIERVIYQLERIGNMLSRIDVKLRERNKCNKLLEGVKNGG